MEPAEELREHELRVKLMEAQIHKAEFDMEIERQRFRLMQKQLNRQTWAIVFGGIGAAAALIAAGVGLGKLLFGS